MTLGMQSYIQIKTAVRMQSLHYNCRTSYLVRPPATSEMPLQRFARDFKKARNGSTLQLGDLTQRSQIHRSR